MFPPFTLRNVGEGRWKHYFSFFFSFTMHWCLFLYLLVIWLWWSCGLFSRLRAVWFIYALFVGWDTVHMSGGWQLWHLFSIILFYLFWRRILCRSYCPPEWGVKNGCKENHSWIFVQRSLFLPLKYASKAAGEAQSSAANLIVQTGRRFLIFLYFSDSWLSGWQDIQQG